MRNFTVRILLITSIFLTALSSAFAQAAPVNGQVKKIDEAQGKITLQHDPITNLDMDSMTMVFRVKDQEMLKAISVGDKVVFEADRINGALTVTNIKKVD